MVKQPIYFIRLGLIVVCVILFLDVFQVLLRFAFFSLPLLKNNDVIQYFLACIRRINAHFIVYAQL